MKKEDFIRYLLLLIAFNLLCIGTPLFASEPDSLEQLKAMSLESLMDVTVYSSGHKNQQLSDVSSATYVITKEDIRRSGSRTLPDLLRGVPGLHVANIDGHTWAISARGFNGVFSNKLLVMIDGRSIYTPLYSGVYWDTQDTFLHDIERIEIIRGPGATIWGANAVNGVINIITSDTIQTDSGYLATGIGSVDTNSQDIRFGQSGKQFAYRIYGKRLERDNFDHYNNSTSEAYDNLHNRQAGFRFDWDSKLNTKMTLQGDIFSNKANQLLTYDVVSLPLLYEDVRSRGGNLMATWEIQESSTSQWTIKNYIDRFLREDGYFNQRRTTVDLRINNQRELNAQHEVVWGVEYRYSKDHLITSNEEAFTITPTSAAEELFSIYLQDEWRIKPDLFNLIPGLKIEHNDYTGYEIQPSLKAIWTPSAAQSIWASISRAVRTPSRTENGLSAIINTPDQTIPTAAGPVTVPTYASLQRSTEDHSEKVIAYELGMRSQITTDISLDTAIFYNDYDEIRSIAVNSYEYSNGTLNIPVSFDYRTKGYTYGFETSMVWQVINAWRLNLNYSWLKIKLDSPENIIDLFFENINESTPEHQVSLNSRVDLPYALELDTTFYYFSSIHDTPAHLRTDIRLGWLPTTNWEFSIKGENIFDHSYREYPANFGVISSQVPRSWYAQARYYF